MIQLPTILPHIFRWKTAWPPLTTVVPTPNGNIRTPPNIHQALEIVEQIVMDIVIDKDIVYPTDNR